MSSIEVTARGTTLVLHSCASCGRHLWERDGQLADRAELLEGVKTFLAQPANAARSAAGVPAADVTRSPVSAPPPVAIS
jgi:hypothetical protein